MKKFIIFISEVLASPRLQSIQRQIEKQHNDAIAKLLTVDNKYTENTDASHPNELLPGEFKFFNPSTDDSIRGDLHINHNGTIISIECKGKNPDREKHKNGTHQNDYILRPDTVIRRRSARDFVTPKKVVSPISIRGKASKILTKKDRVRASRISRNWKGIAKSAIPDMYRSLGSDITISGSKHGVAIIPHIPILGVKDEKRKIIEDFLANVGLNISHEINELTTAGSPEFRSDKSDRAVFRVGGIKRNDRTTTNAQKLYPPVIP